MYLYGASGHAKVIMDILEANQIKIEGLIDDNPEVNELLGYPVFHQRNDLSPLIISIGNNQIRRKIAERLDVEFGTAIHPSAVVSPSAKIGEGTVVMPGAVINADAVIGKHCIINTGSTIDHECVIEDYCHIAPGVNISGCTTIGEGTWVGVGSCVIQCLHIGKNCMIGAGSVVVKDIPDSVVAFGNPCRVIRKNE